MEGGVSPVSQVHDPRPDAAVVCVRERVAHQPRIGRDDELGRHRAAQRHMAADVDARCREQLARVAEVLRRVDDGNRRGRPALEKVLDQPQTRRLRGRSE
jgi:hypothetical protein